MTTLRPLLIAGPTASGKSRYALERAGEEPCVIINADSMQVYDGLRVITARPSHEDVAAIPHDLYGHVSPSCAYSVGHWCQDVEQALARAAASNRRPIVVGGTGLYFKALLDGLSPVPEIPAEIRAKWRDAGLQQDTEHLHRQLMDVDPVMAERLRPSDPQRIVRALEVFEATGKSLAYWQTVPGVRLLEFRDVEAVVITRPRQDLYDRADARLEQMLLNGAVEEVCELGEQKLEPSLPAMRALGVPQLLQLIAGNLDRKAALYGAKLQTRHYIKRQLTWIRRNMSSWKAIEKK
ncbi:MAG: tRNA (adenosine(37)-N6)-dimethylallyltransferase MiaA [Hyphomicrobiaceae bacterium]